VPPRILIDSVLTPAEIGHEFLAMRELVGKDKMARGFWLCVFFVPWSVGRRSPDNERDQLVVVGRGRRVIGLCPFLKRGRGGREAEEVKLWERKKKRKLKKKGRTLKNMINDDKRFSLV
jgi:hypothetical protein